MSHATICAYFRAGIITGVLPFESSTTWAFSVIERMDAPPIPIIEVATSRDCTSALDALQVASRGAELQATGRLLLADIHVQMERRDISTADAIRLAMRACRTTELADHLYDEFDGLDDALQLAINDTRAASAEIGADVLAALATHAKPT